MNTKQKGNLAERPLVHYLIAHNYLPTKSTASLRLFDLVGIEIGRTAKYTIGIQAKTNRPEDVKKTLEFQGSAIPILATRYDKNKLDPRCQKIEVRVKTKKDMEKIQTYYFRFYGNKRDNKALNYIEKRLNIEIERKAI